GLRLRGLRDFPKSCLLAPTNVMPLLALADGIPARLVLRVVIASSNYEMFFSPHNQIAKQETHLLQLCAHPNELAFAVPDVGNVAWEQRPCLRPVCSVIIGDHALGGILAVAH